MIPTKYDLPLTGLDWLEYYSAHNVYHPGVDFNKGYGNSDCGQDIFAAKGGFVEFVWNSTWNSGGFGKFIVLHHDDGTFTRYAHLKDIGSTIRSGKQIKEGDLIGHLGNTGTTYCHLHFEVFNKKCAEWQSKHWRRWRAYPVGWSKAKIQEYYLNPWEWFKADEPASSLIPSWAKKEVAWCKKNKVINDFTKTTIDRHELAVMLKRLHDLK